MDVFEAFPVLVTGGKYAVQSLAYLSGRLFVGCDDGTLRVYRVLENAGTRAKTPFTLELDEEIASFSVGPVPSIRELVIVPSWQLLLSVTDREVMGHTLDALAQPAFVLPRSRGAMKLVANPASNLLAVIFRDSFRVLAWTAATRPHGASFDAPEASPGAGTGAGPAGGKGKAGGKGVTPAAKRAAELPELYAAAAGWFTAVGEYDLLALPTPAGGAAPATTGALSSSGGGAGSGEAFSLRGSSTAGGVSTASGLGTAGGAATHSGISAARGGGGLLAAGGTTPSQPPPTASGLAGAAAWGARSSLLCATSAEWAGPDSLLLTVVHRSDVLLDVDAAAAGSGLMLPQTTSGVGAASATPNSAGGGAFVASAAGSASAASSSSSASSEPFALTAAGTPLPPATASAMGRRKSFAALPASDPLAAAAAAAYGATLVSDFLTTALLIDPWSGDVSRRVACGVGPALDPAAGLPVVASSYPAAALGLEAACWDPAASPFAAATPATPGAVTPQGVCVATAAAAAAAAAAGGAPPDDAAALATAGRLLPGWAPICPAFGHPTFYERRRAAAELAGFCRAPPPVPSQRTQEAPPVSEPPTATVASPLWVTAIEDVLRPAVAPEPDATSAADGSVPTSTPVPLQPRVTVATWNGSAAGAATPASSSASSSSSSRLPTLTGGAVRAMCVFSDDAAAAWDDDDVAAWLDGGGGEGGGDMSYTSTFGAFPSGAGGPAGAVASAAVEGDEGFYPTCLLEAGGLPFRLTAGAGGITVRNTVTGSVAQKVKLPGVLGLAVCAEEAALRGQAATLAVARAGQLPAPGEAAGDATADAAPVDEEDGEEDEAGDSGAAFAEGDGTVPSRGSADAQSSGRVLRLSLAPPESGARPRTRTRFAASSGTGGAGGTTAGSAAPTSTAAAASDVTPAIARALLARPERVFAFVRGGVVLMQMVPAVMLLASLLSARPPQVTAAVAACDQLEAVAALAGVPPKPVASGPEGASPVATIGGLSAAKIAAIRRDYASRLLQAGTLPALKAAAALLLETGDASDPLLAVVQEGVGALRAAAAARSGSGEDDLLPGLLPGRLPTSVAFLPAGLAFVQARREQLLAGAAGAALAPDAHAELTRLDAVALEGYVLLHRLVRSSAFAVDCPADVAAAAARQLRARLRALLSSNHLDGNEQGARLAAAAASIIPDAVPLYYEGAAAYSTALSHAWERVTAAVALCPSPAALCLSPTADAGDTLAAVNTALHSQVAAAVMALRRLLLRLPCGAGSSSSSGEEGASSRSGVALLLASLRRLLVDAEVGPLGVAIGLSIIAQPDGSPFPPSTSAPTASAAQSLTPEELLSLLSPAAITSHRLYSVWRMGLPAGVSSKLPPLRSAAVITAAFEAVPPAAAAGAEGAASLPAGRALLTALLEAAVVRGGTPAPWVWDALAAALLRCIRDATVAGGVDAGVAAVLPLGAAVHSEAPHHTGWAAIVLSLRQRLLAAVTAAPVLDCSLALASFPPAPALPDERVLLLRRLGAHKEALSLLVAGGGTAEDAIAYCDAAYAEAAATAAAAGGNRGGGASSEADAGDEEGANGGLDLTSAPSAAPSPAPAEPLAPGHIYTMLLEACAGLTDDPATLATQAQVLNALALRAERMSPAAALAALPARLPMTAAAPLLQRLVELATTRRRTLEVSRQLVSLSAIEAHDSLAYACAGATTLDRRSLCALCGLRLASGTGSSSFVLLPLATLTASPALQGLIKPEILADETRRAKVARRPPGPFLLHLSCYSDVSATVKVAPGVLLPGGAE